MNHWSSSEAQPAQLSRLMAELVNRLRLSHEQNPDHDISWPVCLQLRVQADLLGGLAEESALEDLLQFTIILKELTELGRNEPQCISRSWSGVLNRLAGFLDLMISGLDHGDSPETWLEDPQWERFHNWFAHLETPFLVMDEMEEIMLRWQNAWCDGALKSEDEGELQERWLSLRKFGDALFGSSSGRDSSNLLHWNGFTPKK